MQADEREDPGCWRLVLWIGMVLLGCGCRPGIGVRQVTPAVSRLQVEQTALEGGLSATTHWVLHRHELDREGVEHPDVAARVLHGIACGDDRRDLLFALAEVNYLAGERFRRSVRPGEAPRSRDHYLASVVYAYAYLFSEGREARPAVFDWQFRKGCDLYNLALARAFSGAGWGALELTNGVRRLPVGSLGVEVTRPGFPWSLEGYSAFLPADQYVVRGVSVRVTEPGLGAPAVAVERAGVGQSFQRRSAVTLFLRVEGAVKDLGTGGVRAKLELYSGYDDMTVMVGQWPVPLAMDTTIPMAMALEQSRWWDLGIRQFLSGEEWVPSGVYPTQPYRPGRIPIVFVHGTASSPVYWAEMWNALRADPVLRKRYQFWVYAYNTGNPLPYSAARLRQALAEEVRHLDPEGRDEAMREMVLVGHSQGGLLAKLAVVDPVDVVGYAERLPGARGVRGGVEGRWFRALKAEGALPFVKRVVYVATPHRGSFLVRPWLASLLRKWIDFPADVLKLGKVVVNPALADNRPMGWLPLIPTSFEGMAAGDPILEALSQTEPVAPVRSHSIIAVRGGGDPRLGDDGAVAYSSAHLDGVESEKVVRAGHSCQDHPGVIEEVRRILLRHLEAADARRD